MFFVILLSLRWAVREVVRRCLPPAVSHHCSLLSTPRNYSTKGVACA